MATPPADPERLNALLERARGGDADALGELLRRYEQRVRLAARSLLRPPLRHLFDSLDMVQSVHRALIPGLRDGRYSFADENQLIALAVTVLRHKVRRTARRKTLAEAAEAIVPVADPESQPAPAELLAAQEQYATILAGLEEIDRRLIEMRVQDYSTAEIARSLGLTPAVMRARLSRLRKRLREAGHDEWL